MDDLIQEFLVESNENLDRLDSELVKLESDPTSAELLASIFRSIHSIKGACGFLGFNKLQALAHAGESLLSKLRDGAIALTPEISSALLACGDGIRQMLAAISATGQDGEELYSELIETLKRLQEGEAPVAAEAALSASVMPERGDQSAQAECVATAPVELHAPEEFENPDAEPVLDSPAPCDSDSPARASAETHEVEDPHPQMASSSAMAASTVHESADAPRIVEDTRNKAAAVQDSTIRVNVTLLDRLMNLVGELVLARNQIMQYATQQDDSVFVGTIQQLNLVTSELREGVMKTRMQPISRLFDKVPRVVRDVSVACGKQVRIETEGKDTELDRTLLEAINDPLTHLVRNAIDHGIERPDRRRELGKPAEGLLKLRALHEGGQVTIEISDDGAGIDAERIRKTAVERGTLTAEQAARMGPAEALNLIFLPGVSTAEKVTNVSGRGVGMDVVKTNIERVGGSVEIQTRLGEGATFKIKVPLTLAIVPALIVRSAGKCFAIPQVNLVELVRLEAGQRSTGIEMVHGAPVYRLRGRLLPLIELNHELNLANGSKPGSTSGGAVNIVVLQVDSRRFGLVVDEVNDAEEIVVKPLSKHLKGIKAYAGATIMGDGKLALILDVLGLAGAAGVTSESRERTVSKEVREAQDKSAEKQEFVLFTGPGDSRMALPLGSLARLEEFSRSQVERSGNQWTMQYRGKILPLVWVSQALDGERDPFGTSNGKSSDLIEVLVLSDGGRTFGLVVDKILDIVEATTDVKSPATRAGVLYSAVIAEHVTELLDVPAIRRICETYPAAQPEFVEVSE